MAAELGSDCRSASQSLFSNMETAFTQRIQMRSFLLIYLLFKRIFFFELELRFASSLMVQEASGGPGMSSAFPKEEEENISSKNVDILSKWLVVENVTDPERWHE